MKRLLWTVVLALALGAAALWGAGRLVWSEPARDSSLTWPTPLAVLALAAVGAVLALSGIARRVLGGVLVIAGAAACVLAVADAELFGVGPVLALVGGVLIIGAGGLLVFRGQRLPRLGAKYSAPAANRAAPDSDGDLWNALSDGRDPTTDPTKDPAKDQTTDG